MRNRLTLSVLLLVASPAFANPCDDAKTRLREAVQALSGDIPGDPLGPATESRIITGAPSLEKLHEEAAAASREVDRACSIQPPSR